MPKEFARSERVAQMVIRHLAVILRNDVKDPRVSALSITDVDVTKDLRQAKVFVTSLSDDQNEIDDAMDALEKANGYLRRALAGVIELRHCPILVFSYDNSISEGARMSALIDQALNRKD